MNSSAGGAEGRGDVRGAAYRARGGAEGLAAAVAPAVARSVTTPSRAALTSYTPLGGRATGREAARGGDGARRLRDARTDSNKLDPSTSSVWPPSRPVNGRAEVAGAPVSRFSPRPGPHKYLRSAKGAEEYFNS